MTIIDCVSDIHGYYPKLQGGDILIIAGDMTARDKIDEWGKFYRWLSKQKYDCKIIIAGNHDSHLQGHLTCEQYKEIFDEPDYENQGYYYLCDSGVEFKGLKFWGTPWTNWFKGVNRRCAEFMVTEDELEKKYSLIPKDTDILISHGAPFGVLDKNDQGLYCGSKSLSDKMLEIDAKLHVFGHIHESYGTKIENGRLFVNASYVDEFYRDVNKPIRVEVDECRNFVLKSGFY